MAWFRRNPLGLEALQRHLKDELALNPFVSRTDERPRRKHALTAPPQALGLIPEHAKSDVWSVVIDTRYPKGLVSLVVGRGDLTALVFSTGVTLPGRGASAEGASREVLEAAAGLVDGMPPADGSPPPPIGHVAIHVRTSRGIQRVMAAEGELVAGCHNLSPLYRAGLRLMAEILAMDT